MVDALTDVLEFHYVTLKQRLLFLLPGCGAQDLVCPRGELLGALELVEFDFAKDSDLTNLIHNHVIDFRYAIYFKPVYSAIVFIKILWYIL